MTAAPAPLEVFISYAPADEEYRQELEKHLSALRQQGLIRPWHLGLVLAGQEHDAVTANRLDSARLILLLVTANYLDARWMEMERALTRHAARDARVVPIIVTACDWEHAPFAKLWRLPRGQWPIVNRGGPIESEGWADVARGIRAAVQELLPAPSVPRSAARADGAAALSPAADPVTQRAGTPVSSAFAPHLSATVMRGRPAETSLIAGGDRRSGSQRAPSRMPKDAPRAARRSYLWIPLLVVLVPAVVTPVWMFVAAMMRAAEDPDREMARLLKEIDDLNGGSGATQSAGVGVAPIFTAEEVAEPSPSPDDLDLLGVQVGVVEFYDGGRASGRMVGKVVDDAGQRHNLVEETELLVDNRARSCVLYNVREGAVITLFDSPTGARTDDWLVLTVKKSHPRYTVATFESDVDDDYVHARYMRKKALNGKVSRVEID